VDHLLPGLIGELDQVEDRHEGTPFMNAECGVRNEDEPFRIPHSAFPISQGSSYAYCERLARRLAGNFYHAFRLLPAGQRRALCALYAFLRIADDLSDGPAPTPAKRAALASWRRQLGDALAGTYAHPVHPALHHAVVTFGIPPRHLEDVLDGVGMDLETDRYATFADLYRYCYRVASAVGLACIHVWGFAGEEAPAHAEAAGIAFQLTNILRDLGEDASRGRVYLPGEDLERFGYGAEQLARGVRDDRFRELMRFQAERAAAYYESAAPLAGLLRPAGRAVFLVMMRTYRGLLDAIVRRDYDVFSSRVRLGGCYKLWQAVRVLPVLWGWSGG
jgi:phytoene synthase